MRGEGSQKKRQKKKLIIVGICAGLLVLVASVLIIRKKRKGTLAEKPLPYFPDRLYPENKFKSQREPEPKDGPEPEREWELKDGPEPEREPEPEAKPYCREASEKKRKKKRKKGKKKRWLFLILFLLALLLIPLFFLGIIRVKGASMEPYLIEGDYIFYLKNSREIQIGDIILFEKNGEKYVKRVHGVSGDTIELTQTGTLLRNGKPQVMENLIVMGSSEQYDLTEEIVIGEEEYFVLGDHRSISLDSRKKSIGNVKEGEIFGRYLFSIRIN